MAIPQLDSGYLQARIDGEFTLARHLGVVVESVAEASVVLRAPLAANANYKGTAFGGSLYCMAVLAGWAWVTLYLARRGLPADTVIQESRMRYLVPVEGELRACSIAPAESQTDKFIKMLRRAGRGRIDLRVEIQQGHTLTTVFEGVFVAAMR